jgi:hypothetical protein
LIISSPILLERVATNVLDNQEKYPFQLVIIHDLSTTICWSANPTTKKESIEALSVLTESLNFEKSLCQLYKPNTWQSVAYSSPSQSQDASVQPAIKLTDSKDIFYKLLSDWTRIIWSDPKTYLQNKLMISTQVFFASQTKVDTARKSSIVISENQILNFFLYVSWFLFNFPWIAIAHLYLVTPGAYLILMLISIWSAKNNIALKTRNYGAVVVLLSTCLSTLLFVSDNGRYTAPFVIFGYILFMVSWQSERSHRD